MSHRLKLCDIEKYEEELKAIWNSYCKRVVGKFAKSGDFDKDYLCRNVYYHLTHYENCPVIKNVMRRYYDNAIAAGFYHILANKPLAHGGISWKLKFDL